MVLFDHKELNEGEIFIGNTPSTAEFPKAELKGLKTIRKGIQAFDIKGGKLKDDYQPVFIHKSEYDTYNKIMSDKLKSIREGN